MWQEPKVDWKVTYDENGEYIGDFFNAEDFNRMKNNIVHLYDIAKILFSDVESTLEWQHDKTYRDYLFADEMNTLVENLVKLASRIGLSTPLNRVEYYDNDKTMTYEELNLIEEWTEKIYDLLQNTLDGRRKLQFNLGVKEDF